MIIGLVLNNKSPTIYGDGKQTRDYLFIDDAIDAYIKLLNSKNVGPYNFGTGVENSILDITNKIYGW
jgi:UDP-glucose 4-epimerase